MQIKDLELSHELSREEQAAVHGGDATGANLGLILMGPVSQSGGSGLSFASPVTNVNVQTPTVTQTNVGFDNDIAALIGSAVGQFHQ
ncbi:MAG TPA: hypothetical protein VJO99_20520 [Burkholderiaceae bacterium]|nr:hypothetical protein [Burkholderiaceae bacterium]